jgi:hypothetical protein
VRETRRRIEALECGWNATWDIHLVLPNFQVLNAHDYHIIDTLSLTTNGAKSVCLANVPPGPGRHIHHHIHHKRLPNATGHRLQHA